MTMFYSEYLAVQEQYDLRGQEYQPPFLAMFALAFSLHIVVLLVWSLIAPPARQEVSLNALNIRLGGGEEIGTLATEQQKKSAPAAKKTAPKPKPKKKVRAVPLKPITLSEPAKPKRAAPSYSRTSRTATSSATSRLQGAGVNYGNSAEARQLVFKRYTQQLQAKVTPYLSDIDIPADIKQNLSGKIAVNVELQIATSGYVRAHKFVTSSGYAALDKLVLDAIRKAAPFPPPPPEFSGYAFQLPFYF